MDSIHTDACVAALAAWEAEKAEFEKQHPDYCRHCDGWGGHAYTFNPDPGSGHGGLEDYDVCGYCVDLNKCPLCGGALLESGEPCAACGWDAESNQPAGLRDALECECWLKEIDEAEARLASIEGKFKRDFWAGLSSSGLVP